MALFHKETSKNHRMGRVKVASSEDKHAHTLPAGASAQRGADSSLQLDASRRNGTYPTPLIHGSRAEGEKKNLPVL